MKISVDDKELFKLSDIQKKVIQNDISEEIFDQDMKRRLQYILMHKYEQCFMRLKAEWDTRIGERFGSIPANPDAYAKLVFGQKDYLNKKAREEKGL